MIVRRATGADRSSLRELWEQLGEEVEVPSFAREGWEEAWPDVERRIREGVALVAEEREVVGFALADLGETNRGAAHVSDLYVRPRARRQGVAKALLAEVVVAAHAAGLTHLTLDVLSSSAAARGVYDRLGLREYARFLAADAGALSKRLSGAQEGESFGSIHVQTDDRDAVQRAVERFLPRIGRSGGTWISQPRNGWVAVYDELCDRDPRALRRLGRELSDRWGAVVVALGVEVGSVVRMILLERGRIVDEYLSVPSFYGPVPPGDLVALAVNPTIVARLTGALPASVRAVARTASTPSELPPARELLAGLAQVLGLEGGDTGYVDVSTIES